MRRHGTLRRYEERPVCWSVFECAGVPRQPETCGPVFAVFTSVLHSAVCSSYSCIAPRTSQLARGTSFKAVGSSELRRAMAWAPSTSRSLLLLGLMATTAAHPVSVAPVSALGLAMNRAGMVSVARCVDGWLRACTQAAMLSCLARLPKQLQLCRSGFPAP